MNPETKYYTIVTSITVVIMFTLFSSVLPLLQSLSSSNAVIGSLVTFIASAGAYNLLAKLLVVLMRHLSWLKKFILGPHYLEGTWVGYFTGRGGDVRLAIEFFEQDLNSLEVSGKSYTDKEDQHAWWGSDAINLNVRKGLLQYVGMIDIAKRPETFQGISVFKLIRKNSLSPATSMTGYYADLIDGKRSDGKLVKVSSEGVPVEEALEKAKDIAKTDGKLP